MQEVVSMETHTLFKLVFGTRFYEKIITEWINKTMGYLVRVCTNPFFPSERPIGILISIEKRHKTDFFYAVELE